MRNAPVGPLLLAGIGLPLLAGGIGGGILRSVFAENRSGPIGWIYVVSTGTVAATAVVWIVLRWRRWLAPCAAADGPVPERAWLAAAAIAGLGAGAFSGALNKVGDPHWAAILGYFVFVPVAYFVMILGTPAATALLRVLVATLALEVGAQTGWSLVHRGMLAYWDDITVMDVGFGLGAAVLTLLVAPRRARIAAWLARRRLPPPPAPGPDAPPRRA